MIRYIGIDPGKVVGVVAISEAGEVLGAYEVSRPNATTKRPLWASWGLLVYSLRSRLYEQLDAGDVVVVLSNPIQRASVLVQGRIEGVVWDVAYARECQVLEARDKQARAVVVGHGGASEEQCQAAAVARFAPAVGWSEHLVDAWVAAEWARRGQ